jgi:hypothetical protein
MGEQVEYPMAFENIIRSFSGNSRKQLVLRTTVENADASPVSVFVVKEYRDRRTGETQEVYKSLGPAWESYNSNLSIHRSLRTEIF